MFGPPKTGSVLVRGNLLAGLLDHCYLVAMAVPWPLWFHTSRLMAGGSSLAWPSSGRSRPVLCIETWSSHLVVGSWSEIDWDERCVAPLRPCGSGYVYLAYVVHIPSSIPYTLEGLPTPITLSLVIYLFLS